jgi:hypothetical protein
MSHRNLRTHQQPSEHHLSVQLLLLLLQRLNAAAPLQRVLLAENGLRLALIRYYC